MRWNCPHCEELVTAGIDFENTKKAYVRCAKCNGMALVHRSAVLADYVKARRMEEEAQLEAELHLTANANANHRVHSMEGQIRGLNEKLNTAALNLASASATPPPPNAAMSAGMSAGMEVITARPPTPPPFLSSFETNEDAQAEITIMHDTYSAPPVFLYSKPPAFLLKQTANAIETLERSFAIDGNIAPIDAMTATPVGANPTRPKTAASKQPMIALWLAATLAIGSGAYLFVQGKKALAPSPPLAPPAIQADEIRSKANSAIRPETRSLAIVKVSKAVLRSGPSVDSSPVRTLERSAVANVVESKDGWMRIESPQIATASRSAWIRADLVALMPK